MCFSKFVPANLQVFLDGMDCLQEGKIQGPRSGLQNYIRFPVWAAGQPSPQVSADSVLLKDSMPTRPGDSDGARSGEGNLSLKLLFN